jgi:hypothetical protein
MELKLFRRREIWFPTWQGWLLILLLAIMPPTFWWFRGEKFLCITQRHSAELLIVEGWIGVDGLQAAVQEFRQGSYRYLVVAGSKLTPRWGAKDWDAIEEAKSVLLKAGMPIETIVLSPAPITSRQRTFESARTVHLSLTAKGLQTKTVNVFTQGAHARRTLLAYTKALVDAPSVGIISWRNANDQAGNWWESSERAQEMIKETIGYFYELLLNSGRGFRPGPAGRMQ